MTKTREGLVVLLISAFLIAVPWAFQAYAQSMSPPFFGASAGIGPTGPLGAAVQFTDGAGNSMYFVGASNLWGFTNDGVTPGAGGTIRFAAAQFMSSGTNAVHASGPLGRLSLATGSGVTWSSTTDATANVSASMRYDGGAGNGIALYGDSSATNGAHILLREKTAPSAPIANNVLMYAVDIAGVTNFCLQFAGGDTVCTPDPAP
ncbi:MAG: hypothetical protein E6Q97_37515 [Desulfurellales bacterium]|nr:MAG: hypothetical protein E6Q97_37515 [Desulfurellales bacterium]